MATLVELVAAGELVRLDPQLDPTELELRVFLMFPRVQEWLEGVLPTLGSTWNIEIGPTEQLAAFVADYASGLALTPGQRFHPMKPHSKGVWELKTADLRMFGWFAKQDHFVCASMESKERLKEMPGLYTGYRDEVVRFREALALDEPKFVQGTEPNDVLSNCPRTP